MRTLLSVILLGILAFCVESNATVFYSIEITRDELVLIDSKTGSVASLGTIDTDMRDPDLVVVDNVIYVLNSLFTDGFAQILSLDHGGNILSLDSLNVEGVPVSHAEGLTAIDGELWASFHLESESPFSSDAFGRLSINGDLTDIVSFVGIDPIVDGDGLCRNPSAEALWLDVNPPGLDTRQLVDVSRPPESEFQQHNLHSGYIPVSDLDFNAAGDSLWAIGSDGLLRLISYPSFAILDSLQYDGGNTLVGLALASLVTDVPSDLPDLARHVVIYPNPATGRLFLDVPVRKQGVRVTVYDAGGRGIWSAGSRAGHLEWDMRNASAQPVSSGIYFVRVSSGSEEMIRRVTVFR